MASTPSLQVFDDASGVVAAALRHLTECATESIAARGRFSIALSGGSTPKALYRAWSEHREWPWQASELCFGDERCVPPDHPDSNARMVSEALTHQPFVPAERVHRVPAELVPSEAARRYEASLRALFADSESFPRFDLILLGLGTDGHTASLFPHTPALTEERAWVCANPGPSADSTRITLTFPVLNAARNVLFLVVGADKRSALTRLLGPEGNIADTPARGVRPNDGTCVIFADRAAVAR